VEKEKRLFCYTRKSKPRWIVDQNWISNEMNHWLNIFYQYKFLITLDLNIFPAHVFGEENAAYVPGTIDSVDPLDSWLSLVRLLVLQQHLHP
jgi:hypothetical protein